MNTELDRQLREIAAVLVAAAPQPSTVVPEPFERRAAQSTRLVPLVAAVSIVAAGTAGVIVLERRAHAPGSATSGPTTVITGAPTTALTAVAPRASDPASEPEPAPSPEQGPTAFPVVDVVDAGVARVAASYGDLVEAPPFVEALIARRDDDTLVDAVTLNVGHPDALAPNTLAAEEVEVGGEPAALMPSTSALSPAVVVWGTDPVFVAAGEDPMRLLGALAPRALSASWVEGLEVPALTISSLPDEYEIFVPSQVVPARGRNAILEIDANEVVTSTRNWLPTMATVGEVREVAINGSLGWILSGEGLTRDVTWEVGDSGTYAYLKINHGRDADAALELARTITFAKSADEWAELYDVELPTQATPSSTVTPTSTVAQSPTAPTAVDQSIPTSAPS